MINPSIGRVVWFHPPKGDENIVYRDQALAAIVTYVWSDRMVNLVVFDANGLHSAHTSVNLLQDDDAAPEYGRYAEWMPFQKGQAMKFAELEKKIDAA